MGDERTCPDEEPNQLSDNFINADKTKSNFKYDQSSGLLSHDSDKTQWNNFCVQAYDVNNSRLRVAVCDASDMFQVWDFDNLNGHVYLRSDRRGVLLWDRLVLKATIRIG